MSSSAVTIIEGHLRTLLHHQHLLLLRADHEPTNAAVLARKKPIDDVLDDLRERLQAVNGASGFLAYDRLSREAYLAIASIIKARRAALTQVQAAVPEDFFATLVGLVESAREVYVTGDATNRQLCLEHGTYDVQTSIAIWKLQQIEDGLSYLVAPDIFLEWCIEGTPRAANDLPTFLRQRFGDAAQIVDGIAWLPIGASIPMNQAERTFHAASLGKGLRGGEAMQLWLETLNQLSYQSQQYLRERAAVAAAHAALAAR